MDFFNIPPEKGIDILTAESEVDGFNQCLIKASQFFAALEINVGCKLALIYAPVVRVVEDIPDIREETVDLVYDPVKGIRQLFVQYTVCQFLCFIKIFYVGKGIVIHGKRNTFRLQESGEVFMPVKVKLDIVREPCLDLEEHPSKLAVIIMNKIYIPHLKWGPRQSRSVT